MGYTLGETSVVAVAVGLINKVFIAVWLPENSDCINALYEAAT
jgi:hypothetical protein